LTPKADEKIKGKMARFTELSSVKIDAFMDDNGFVRMMTRMAGPHAWGARYM